MVESLVLIWEGQVVQEGCDRAARNVSGMGMAQEWMDLDAINLALKFVSQGFGEVLEDGDSGIDWRVVREDVDSNLPPEECRKQDHYDGCPGITCEDCQVEEASLIEKEHAPKSPEVLHYKTQDDQPYGSESRKCSECGIMIWGANQPRWTDDHKVWESPPEGSINCRKARDE